MSTPKQLEDEITKLIPNVMKGTLRFWGEWFGGPYDNVHVLVSCDATEDCLRLRFDQGEVLAVWNPADVEISAMKFRIGDAKALRWSWYYYGRPQTPENLFYKDYARQDARVLFRTNRDQVPGEGWVKSPADFPAIEMY